MFLLRSKISECTSLSWLPAISPPRICRAISSIVLGVRAYAARDELKTYNSRLLDYVKNGGVLIVQYNTPEFDHNFGPYPYEMGSKSRRSHGRGIENRHSRSQEPCFPVAQPDYFSVISKDGWKSAAPNS